jgi:hypothetical protein
MRIMGFMLLLLLAIPNLVCFWLVLIKKLTLTTNYQTLRRRLPPVNVSGGLIHLKPFRLPALFLYTVSGFFCFLGLYTGTYPFASSLHLAPLTTVN